MERVKPVMLTNISLAREGKIYVIESFNITFLSRHHLENFIEERREYWSGVCGFNLSVFPDSSETLLPDEILTIFQLTCEKIGVEYEEAKFKRGAQEFVEARRLAIGICINRKASYSSIGRALGLNHSTILYHRRKIKEFMIYDKAFARLFNDTEDYVLTKLSGQFSEDGSGEKIEQ